MEIYGKRDESEKKAKVSSHACIHIRSENEAPARTEEAASNPGCDRRYKTDANGDAQEEKND